MKIYKGFTLIEVIVSVGIITLLGTLLVPISINQIYYSRSESIASVLASSLYTQQQNSFNSYENNEYGVVVNTNTITLYTGTSYAANTSSRDIETEGVVLQPSLGGGTEIHFSKNSLKPSVSGTILSSYGDANVTVLINSEGMISIVR